MTRSSRGVVIAITLLATPLVADAQTCLGLAPFSAGRVQLAAGASFGNDSKEYGASLSFGSTTGPFAGVSVGTVSYEEFDGNTTTVGAQFGWQVPIGTENRVELCPGAGAAYGFGPDNIEGSGTDLSAWSAFFGLQLGVSAGSNPQLRIVPTVGAALAYSKVDFEGGFFGGIEEDDTFGVFTLGLGLVLNTRVSILPSVDIFVGLEDADPSFGVMLGVNF
jgi:hypothetical protein